MTVVAGQLGEMPIFHSKGKLRSSSGTAALREVTSQKIAQPTLFLHIYFSVWKFTQYQALFSIINSIIYIIKYCQHVIFTGNMDNRKTYPLDSPFIKGDIYS